MNGNSWQRLTGLVMGMAVALALIVVVSYIADATDQRDIAGPKFLSRAAF